MNIVAALDEYKKLYNSRLKKLRDENPDLFEKFEDYVVNEEFEDLLKDEEIRDYFGIGSYSYYSREDSDIYLLYLVKNRIGLDESLTYLKDTNSYVSMDFLKLSLVNGKDVKIEPGLWEDILGRLRTATIIDELIPVEKLTIEYGSHRSNYSDLMKSLHAQDTLIKGSLANLIIPSSDTVTVISDDVRILGSQFSSDDIKVLDLSKCNHLQVLDNNVLSRVEDKIILPDSTDAPDFRLVGRDKDISPNLRIVRKQGLRIKCNKEQTEDIRKHLDTI